MRTRAESGSCTGIAVLAVVPAVPPSLPSPVEPILHASLAAVINSPQPRLSNVWLPHNIPNQNPRLLPGLLPRGLPRFLPQLIPPLALFPFSQAYALIISLSAKLPLDVGALFNAQQSTLSTFDFLVRIPYRIKPRAWFDPIAFLPWSHAQVQDPAPVRASRS